MKSYSVSLLFCFSMLLFLSCSKEESVDVVPVIPPPVLVDTTGYRFLALGDSYTFGSGVFEEDSWPFQLRDRMEEEGARIGEMEIIAAAGWATPYLLDQIEQQQPEQADLVSLQIGVNDQFQGRTFEEFKMGFDQLLTKATDLARGVENVIVLSIPDYGVTPFGQADAEQIAEELDAYNAYISQQCADNAIVFINITEISRQLGDGENALASDNLHPSGYQYKLWLSKIWLVAKEKLED